MYIMVVTLAFLVHLGEKSIIEVIGNDRDY